MHLNYILLVLLDDEIKITITEIREKILSENEYVKVGLIKL